MSCVQQVVSLERQLFVSLPPFTPEADVGAAQQAQRLELLASSLFSALDVISNSPTKQNL